MVGRSVCHDFLRGEKLHFHDPIEKFFCEFVAFYYEELNELAVISGCHIGRTDKAISDNLFVPKNELLIMQDGQNFGAWFASG